MKVLVTGAAGFIGRAVAYALLERGFEVIGWDNLDSYYDVSLKLARLETLKSFPAFQFEKLDLTDERKTANSFRVAGIEKVVHLAAHPGVRHSLMEPMQYVDANVRAFVSLLEASRLDTTHFVFGSTSSVYGLNRALPFSTTQTSDHPASLYAATKKAGELMAHAYSHLYQLPVTGLRFFTVYGPWGRPDMALFDFVKKILDGEPITLHNHGNHKRDFTYIDDVVEVILRVLDRPPCMNPSWDAAHPKLDSSSAPFRIYNVGSHSPVSLMDFLHALENILGKKASYESVEMQKGDILDTFADVDSLESDFSFRPVTPLDNGLREFVSWYKKYFGKDSKTSESGSRRPNSSRQMESF